MGAGIDFTENAAAPTSMERKNNAKYGAVFGLNRTATRRTEGAISFSVSIHLPPIENSNAVNPVMLPPGRAKLATNPWPTGSETDTNTIGIVRVSCWNAANPSVALAKMTSGANPTSSAAEVRMLLGSPVAHR
jgi:hypothetical protein